MTSSFGFGALGEETALFVVVEFVRRCFDAGESFCWLPGFFFLFFLGGGGRELCGVFLVCFVGWAMSRPLKQVRFGRADQVI